MISLWILAILTLFAVSLGSRAAINLKLAAYQRDGLKAYCLAKAGINQAILLLKTDLKDPETKDYDTDKLCGINLEGRGPKEVFGQSWNNGADGFKIGHQDPAGGFVFGMLDEDRKINILGTGDSDRKRITALLKAKSIEGAQELAGAITDWMKPGSKIDIAKKSLLVNPAELSPVLEYFYQQKGMADYRERAKVAFNKIEDSITFYADKETININTVDREVLSIFAASIAEAEQMDGIDTVVGEMIKLKDEKLRLNQPFKESGDIKIEETRIDPTDSRGALFAALKNRFIFKSGYFKIEATGNIGKINKNIVAIYDRQRKKIVSWHEN